VRREAGLREASGQGESRSGELSELRQKLCYPRRGTIFSRRTGIIPGLTASLTLKSRLPSKSPVRDSGNDFPAPLLSAPDPIPHEHTTPLFRPPETCRLPAAPNRCRYFENSFEPPRQLQICKLTGPPIRHQAPSAGWVSRPSRSVRAAWSWKRQPPGAGSTDFMSHLGHEICRPEFGHCANWT
jgi:hypothetical protein